ncbi:MAG TPA: pyridoxamine 5'-phosphate oxidase family protein [Caulobacteraceae bacterium]|jgi:general stress protein 26|nr:pyridoxamine 5'-phosphate oxidase family protein [Caulobacteraceae bacterium]
MTTDVDDKAAVEKKLWSEIEDTRFGMIAAMAPAPDHFQPMTAFPEPESRTLWFYTRRDADLAVAAEDAVESMFVFTSKDRQLQASIRGRLRASTDALHRDKFWNSVVAAWYPKGKDDPELVMLAFTCEDAQIWLSEGGGAHFGWEIAKANLTGQQPDVGSHVSVKMS